MKIWVTRAEQDAAVLRANLIAQGHEVVVEPLLKVQFLELDKTELNDVQALIATSRNGVRAAAASADDDFVRQLPLFAVGPGTASTARALGFVRTISGSSKAKHLLKIIERHTSVNGGPLLHLAGANLAFDLAGRLQEIGYHVLQPTVYIAHASQQLSAKFLPQLAAGDIHAVILLSPRTAHTYVKLIEAHQLVRCAQRLTHYCLSEAVADQLFALSARRVVVAGRPNLDELLSLTGQSTDIVALLDINNP
ncbi:MAG: uroporphyrinogen-III synthase [Hyphomicrobiaceae bacterium]